MNREDVKIGEKYKVVGKRDYDFEEGEIITISSPYTGDNNWFKTKEKGIIIHCSNFEPINKFEVGMKVETENGEYTIDEIYKEMVRFKGWTHFLSAKDVEPVNQFEVGDEVIYSCYHCLNQIKHKSVIFGIKDNQYAIKYTHKSVDHYAIVKERRLSPLKKKDELEIGDKFKVKTAEGASKRINEVLGIFKDKYYNQTKYAAKRLNRNYEGFVDIYNSEMIAEIIYD